MLSRFLLLLAGASLAGLGVAAVQSWRSGGGRGAAFQAQPAAPPPPPRVRVAAAGDVMLDRGVWNRIKDHGIHHVMRDVRDPLRAADVAFVNLECPLSTVQGHARPGGSLEFCADPMTAQALDDAGVDIVAIANNHGLDAGTRGCEDTMATLEAHQIAYAGGRPEGFEPDEITYLTANGAVVAFLAYTDLNFVHGSLCKVDEDMQNALARVREARNQADLVCVSYHWGEEYRKDPTARQIELGHATIEAGADIILGHHPHVLSGVERYRDGLILYSMGNFVFDQRDADDGRMNSAIFTLDATIGRSLDLTITPLRIVPADYAPRTPTPERAGAILTELAELSADLGVDLTIESGRARASFVQTPPAPPAVASVEAEQSG